MCYLLLGLVEVGNGRESCGSGVCSCLFKVEGQLDRSCSCEVLFETERPMRRIGRLW